MIDTASQREEGTALVRVLNALQDAESRESNPLTRLAGHFLLERPDFLYAEVNARVRPQIRVRFVE